MRSEHSLEALALHRAQDDRHAMLDAWESCRLPGTPVRRRTGNGKDLPMFGIKAPTGAGKTLLATQILGLVYKTLLTARNGAGLVLWVVPTDQIYKDTLKALRDRGHFYRQSLEFALSRRVEVWEKHEITRMTPTQLASNLNVLLLKLQGTNRQDKETLKFFRDTGGNITQHFPPEDDPEGHRALKERITNLEMLEEDPVYGQVSRQDVAGKPGSAMRTGRDPRRGAHGGQRTGAEDHRGLQPDAGRGTVGHAPQGGQSCSAR